MAKVGEEKSKEISARQLRTLKRKEWGEALSPYAAKHPTRPDDGSVRPFVRAVRAALKGMIARDDLQKERFGFSNSRRAWKRSNQRDIPVAFS